MLIIRHSVVFSIAYTRTHPVSLLRPSKCIDPPYKIVTSAGKVCTRAAAAVACQAQGRVLAAVTSADVNEVVKVVHNSPDINPKVFDAVVIDSCNGNTSAGIDLELIVSKFGATVSMLVFPGYPLEIPDHAEITSLTAALAASPLFMGVLP
ncbi:hypothetical protein GGF32_007870, partial [Allomyces javanicus]